MKTIALWFLIFVSLCGLAVVFYHVLNLLTHLQDKGVPLWAFIVIYAAIASAVLTFVFRKF